MRYTFSLAKHGDDKLSRDFRVREFRCHDGSDVIKVETKTVDVLQAVRDYFGKPVTINSAYRTPTWNAHVGGASKSQHVEGTACDIVVKDVPPVAVAAYLEAVHPAHGIGLYRGFTHIDSRGSAKYWDQRTGAQKVVTSFRLGDIYKKYKAVPETVKPSEPVQEPEERAEDMTIAEIKKELLKDKDFCRQATAVYIADLATQQPSDWSKDARGWAVDNGLVKGTATGFEWAQFATFERFLTVLYRYEQMQENDV